MYLFITCMPGAHGGQKASDPLALELRMVVGHCEDACIEPDPLEEQQELLTSDPSLQPLASNSSCN